VSAHWRRVRSADFAEIHRHAVSFVGCFCRLDVDSKLLRCTEQFHCDGDLLLSVEQHGDEVGGDLLAAGTRWHVLWRHGDGERSRAACTQFCDSGNKCCVDQPVSAKATLMRLYRCHILSSASVEYYKIPYIVLSAVALLTFLIFMLYTNVS
jgi:hypothetical protein